VTIEGIPHCADDRSTKHYRLFVNVMAAHPGEAGAVVVCCNDPAGAATTRAVPLSAGDGDVEKESPLCTFKVRHPSMDVGARPCTPHAPSKQLLSHLYSSPTNNYRHFIHDQARAWPLTNRLSKFPDAILLPILPLLLQIVVRLTTSAVVFAASVAGRSRRGPVSFSSSSYLAPSTTTTTYLLSRLFLYICICYFRMYILYLFLNYLEDNTTGLSWGSSTSSSSSSCWYQPYLQRSTSSLSLSIDDSSYCSYRRAFDFSDHIVLYYGQILPIATAETLMTIMTAMTMTNYDRRRGGCSTSAVVLAVGSFFYLLSLYAIVSRAGYGTAAYFHTGTEVYVGYLIGQLCITLPLAYRQYQGWYPFVGPHPRAPVTIT
jgi:hypothetical protein